MRMVDIITSKRNGNELTDEEISFFVRGRIYKRRDTRLSGFRTDDGDLFPWNE